MKNNIQEYLDKNSAAGKKPGNQGELAKMIKMKSRSQLNRIINGHINPAGPVVLRITVALGEENTLKVFPLED